MRVRRVAQVLIRTICYLLTLGFLFLVPEGSENSDTQARVRSVTVVKKPPATAPGVTTEPYVGPTYGATDEPKK